MKATDVAFDERLKNFRSVLEYAPKYKKKLKEQQRTDAELAELINTVTITGNSSNDGSKFLASSRAIRKPQATTKIFKIRNAQEFLREPEEENSVSAPESYEDEDEDRHRRRLYSKRLKTQQLNKIRRNRRLLPFGHSEGMDPMGSM